MRTTRRTLSQAEGRTDRREKKLSVAFRTLPTRLKIVYSYYTVHVCILYESKEKQPLYSIN